MTAQRVVVTDVHGVNHLVHDVLLARVTDGRYQAVCGATVLAAPLCAGEGADDCALCRTTAQSPTPHRGWWSG